MSKIKIQMVGATIRRDAFTTIDTVVAPYELTVLRQKFGKENVKEGEPAHVFEADKDTEYERLCAKYGPESIVKIFGDDGGERLAEMVEKAAMKPTKAEKVEKEDGK